MVEVLPQHIPGYWAEAPRPAPPLTPQIIPTSCTECAARRLVCNGKKPCDQCQVPETHQCSYDWTLGPHIFSLLPSAPDLSEDIQPFARHEYVERSVGAFGTVYRAVKHDNGLVAVKVFDEYHREPYRVLELSVREAWLWSRLQHENIVPLLGVADLAKVCRRERPMLCMVSPWSDAGNILEYLAEHPTAERDRSIWEVSKGLKYLHELDWGPVLHGDLKGNNVIIMVQDGHPTACITDFGLSGIRESFDERSTTSTSACGNPRHMAIERLFPDDFGFLHAPQAETTASDVFELMRCIYEIIVEKPPFHEIAREGALWRVLIDHAHPSRSKNIDDDMWTMMTQAWSLPPSTRPTTADVEQFLSARWRAMQAASGADLLLTSTPEKPHDAVTRAVKLPDKALARKKSRNTGLHDPEENESLQ